MATIFMKMLYATIFDQVRQLCVADPYHHRFAGGDA
jgi:hypothetical protein